jgi:hypothetical protein
MQFLFLWLYGSLFGLGHFFSFLILYKEQQKTKTNSVAFSLQMNYTNQAAAASWQS